MPVNLGYVRATLPHLSRQLRAVADIQMLTGARPVTSLRSTRCASSQEKASSFGQQALTDARA